MSSGGSGESGAGGTLRDLLDEVRAKHGALTPAAVVEEARAPGSPLHSHFSWDEHENSERYLLEQARRLIRRVRINYVDATGPQSVRAFHVTRTPSAPTSEYTPIEEIVVDPLQRALLLRQMERDWHAFRRRWEHMAEFAALISSATGKAV